MPRPVGRSKSSPAYCLHKSSGRAYVTLAGRPVYLGTYDSPESRERYDRVVGEWLASGRPLSPAPAGLPGAPTPAGATVSMIVLAFWRWAEGRYVHADGNPTGEAENYRLAIRELCRLYGDTPAAAFGPKKLKTLRAHVLADRVEKDPTTGTDISRRGWCRSYANRQVKRVQQVFRWAASEELIAASVPAALDTMKAIRAGEGGARESANVELVSDELVDATLPFLPPPVRAMVRVQRLTGARGGELFSLRTCDLDRSGSVWKYRPARHKTAHKGHARVIRFGPQAQQVLSPLLGLDLQAYLFRPAEAVAWRDTRQREQRKTPVTPSQRARAQRAKPRAHRDRYTKDTYAQAVARACDQAFPPPAHLARQEIAALKANGRRFKRWESKVEWRARLGEKGRAELATWRAGHRWHPHQLRHSAGSAFRRAADFEAAKILLGHRTDSMTQHYAERDDHKAEELMARIG